jgi:hypothetical protein
MGERLTVAAETAINEAWTTTGTISKKTKTLRYAKRRVV